MTLEDDLNETNKYYLANQIAVIHKKPTPVQIVNVHYPKEAPQSLRKLILNSLQQLTTTAFIKDATSISRQRNKKQNGISPAEFS